MKKIWIILFLFTFVSCNKKEYINLNEYIVNNISINEPINEDNLLNDIYKKKYKVRLIYSEMGTRFSIYENFNMNNILFDLKYWTIVNPIEIMCNKESNMVKIITEDNRTGWINAYFLELY
jgi:hypothetical protein